MAATEQILAFILKKRSYLSLRTFSEMNTAEDQYSLCRELCRDLAQELQKEGLKVFILFSVYLQKDNTLHSNIKCSVSVKAFGSIIPCNLSSEVSIL